MKLVLAVVTVLAACGPIQTKKESPIVNEGSDTAPDCCCKSQPLTSEDGKPVFAMTKRMECSSQQGECQPDVQCQGTTN